MSGGDATPKLVAPDLTKIAWQQYVLCGACHSQQGEGTAAAELIQSEPPAVSEKSVDSKGSKYDDLKTSFGASLSVYVAVFLFALACLVSVFRKCALPHQILFIQQLEAAAV